MRQVRDGIGCDDESSKFRGWNAHAAQVTGCLSFRVERSDALAVERCEEQQVESKNLHCEPADDDAAAAVSACDAARAGTEPSAALPGVEESECSDLR